MLRGYDYTRITRPSRALFRATINKKRVASEGAAACARPPRLRCAIGGAAGSGPARTRSIGRRRRRAVSASFFVSVVASARRNVTVSFGSDAVRALAHYAADYVTGNQ